MLKLRLVLDPRFVNPVTYSTLDLNVNEIEWDG